MASQKHLQTTILFILLLLACAFSITKIFDYDIWWHLKTGEQIVKELSIPRHDHFAVTTEGKEWIDVHWLSQAIFYLVFMVSGFSGIQLFTACVVLCSLIIISRTGRRQYFRLLILPLLYLAIYATKDRFLPRPDIFTLLFPVIYFFLLHRFIFHDRWAICWIPLLQVLWVNMHGSFILGPLIVFAFCCGETLEWLFFPFLWKRPPKAGATDERRSDPPRSKRRALILASLFFIVILVNLINPYGIAIYSLYSPYLGSFKEFISAPDQQAEPITIQEWFPTFSASAAKYHHTFALFYISLAVICLISFFLNINRFSASLFLVFTGFLLLSFFAIRNVSVFSLLAVPIAADNLSLFFKGNGRPEETFSRKKRIMIFGALLIFAGIIGGSLYDVISNGYYRRHIMPLESGFGISRAFIPAGAAHFLKQERPAPNIYNNFESGGFLLWSLFPDYKVFTDGRYIDPDFDRIYVAAAKDPARWQDLADRYDVGFALLKYPSTDTATLIRELSVSDLWKPVYLDPNSIIFMRDSEKNRKSIAKHRIVFPPFGDRGSLGRDSISFDTMMAGTSAYEDLYDHPVDRFFRKFQISLEGFQKKPIPFEMLNRAYFYRLTGFSNAASEEYEEVMKIMPEYIMVQDRLR